jgi:hypothetical protein
MASSNNSSSNGLSRSAIGSDCAASSRVWVSVRPVIRMVGRLRPDLFTTSNIWIPVISGRSMSTTMHALEPGILLASNSDGLLKVWTWNPAAEISLRSERHIEMSSSTTRTTATPGARTGVRPSSPFLVGLPGGRLVRPAEVLTILAIFVFALVLLDTNGSLRCWFPTRFICTNPEITRWGETGAIGWEVSSQPRADLFRQRGS